MTRKQIQKRQERKKRYQLFKPWRKESELLDDHETYEEAFHTVKQQITNPTMERFIQMLHHEQQQKKKTEQEIHQDSQETVPSLQNAYQHRLGTPLVQTEVHCAMEEVECAMQQAAAETTDLNSILSSLNEGQTEIYNELVHEMEMHNIYLNNECASSQSHQLLRFISGEAGTGKSFLIRALQQYVLHTCKSVNACVVAAPTGLAAFNVGGVTLHRLLMLLVEHDNRMEYNTLSPDAAQEVARVLRKVQLIIIDEVSMVSNLMLAYLHLRLQEVLRTPPGESFGGKHLVVFGDLLQLTPVKGQPVFSILSNKDAVKGIGSIGQYNLWETFTYHELTENMRQAEDLEYGQLLQGIRIGIVSKNIQSILESRTIAKLFTPQTTGPEVMNHLIQQNVSCVTLMPTNKSCNEFNNIMLLHENQPLQYLKSTDTIEGEMLPLELNKVIQSRLKDLESSVSHTAGLESTLTLCKNCRVMLRHNLDVEQGLVNGAMGTVLDFTTHNTYNIITRVTGKFDHREEHAIICRLTTQFKLIKNIYIKRKQFPLSAAYAITVHKAQGLSLEAALIDIGSKTFKEAMAYVALSRVKRLSGLYILQLDCAEIAADRDCVLEYNRLRSLYTPNLLPLPIPPRNAKRTSACMQVLPNNSNVGKQAMGPSKKIAKKQTEKQQQVHRQHTELCGFQNKSGIECYANSTLQLLFSMIALLNDICTNHEGVLCNYLRTLYNEYQNHQCATLSAETVRTIVATTSECPHFKHNEQQDCQEFMLYLFNTLQQETVNIDSFLSISYNWEHVCTHCNSRRIEVIHLERFVILPVPIANKTSFKALTENAVHKNICQQCGHETLSSLRNLQYHTYVIIVLARYTQKIHTKIEGFTATQVSIGGRTFTTDAIIYHEGESTKEGHYTTWLRRQRHWIQCSDSNINIRECLPHCLKDAYILLLQPKFR